MTDRQPIPDVSELQALLAPLNGGTPLGLAVLAALIAAQNAPGELQGGQEQSVDGKAAHEQAATAISSLFRDHVGPYDDVIGNALRITKWEIDDEVHYQAWNCNVDHPGPERFAHPRNRLLQVPKPNIWVWVEAFLGNEGALSIRSKHPYAEEKDGPEERLGQLEAIYCEFQKVKKRVNMLSPWRCSERQKHMAYEAKALENVLRYLRNEANDGKSPADLLGLCAMHGFSGAMTDILGGKYGDIGDLTVNTPLRTNKDSHASSESSSSFALLFEKGTVILPPYSLGAILGHTNVVKHALTELGGNISAPYAISYPSREVEVENPAGSILQWVIGTNQPDMVWCLVAECGFQFRWLDDDELEGLWRLLMEFSAYESGPYRGKEFDSDFLMCCSSRERRFHRSRATYREKEKMLKTLIEVGLPMELYVPVDAHFSLDKEILGAVSAKDAKVSKADEARYRSWDKALPKSVRRARSKIFEACCQYNGVQPSTSDEGGYSEDDEDENGSDEDGCSSEDAEDENSDDEGGDDEEPSKKKSKREDLTLHAHEFYDRLRDMWKGQPKAQAAKLPDFEALDPRWVKQQEKAEKKGEDEDDSDDVSSDNDL